MDIKSEYYTNKYEELSVLSDTEKSKTVLVINKDTGELAVKKTMDLNAYNVYMKIKAINNRHIAKILDCSMIDAKCIVFSEFINGSRLDSIIANNPIQINQAVEYELQLCDALIYIHKNGIIHRDITPKNIIISNDGVLKLIDFDIARQEKAGASQDTKLLGTAGYASPEQYGFAQTNERSDIYSMGVLLRTMLTGKQDGGIEELKSKPIEHKDKIKISKLEQIISKCTEIDNRNRYASVEELAKALKDILGAEREIDKVIKEEQLPDISWKYVLRTIPGFKSGNYVFEILATCIYVTFILAFGSIGWDMPVNWIQRIYAIIMYEAFFIVPYMYLTNIAHIAQRLPKMNFKRKFSRIIYQIFMSFISMIFIIIVIGMTLPLE